MSEGDLYANCHTLMHEMLLSLRDIGVSIRELQWLVHKRLGSQADREQIVERIARLKDSQSKVCASIQATKDKFLATFPDNDRLNYIKDVFSSENIQSVIEGTHG